MDEDKLSSIDPATAEKPAVPKYDVPDMSSSQTDVMPEANSEPPEEAGMTSSLYMEY